MNLFRLPRACLSPHIYQQACRISSRARRGKRRPSDLSTLFDNDILVKSQHQQSDNAEGISWFEKDVKTGETQHVAGNPEDLEVDELRQRIRRLEDKLKGYDSNHDDDTFEPALLEALEPHERVKVEEALKARRVKKEALISGLDIPGLVVPLNLPPLSSTILRRFNKALRDTALDSTSPQHWKELWKWYGRAKRNISGLGRTMPAGAWKLLWDSQISKTNLASDVNMRIVELSDDMTTAGVPLTNEQKDARLGALVSSGKDPLAFEEWYAEYKLTDGHDISNLERGVRLCSTSGRHKRALDTARKYFSLAKEPDVRILHPVISAYIKVGDHAMAYSLYQALRDRLGQNMRMDDYDVVMEPLLAKNEMDLALAIFQDLMSGIKAAIPSSSKNRTEAKAIRRALFDRLNRLGSLRRHSTGPEETNSVNLLALPSMPAQWNNKYFYASWIKKLLGAGHIDYAAKVIDLMYERGLRPDIKHMNGMVGAYLRAGDVESQSKGEGLAWSLIYERLEMVVNRHKAKDEPLPDAIHQIEEAQRPIQYNITRSLPAGSIETFNLLAFHYLFRKQWGHFRHLERILRVAELPLSTFFMNHLLYMQLYTNGPAATLRDYYRYRKVVVPGQDAETFNCLWTANLKFMESRPKPEDDKFPTSRGLFAIMSDWHNGLDARSKIKSREFFSDEIYAKIIQSFCLQRDLQGALVAMHGLYKMFDATPNADVARLLAVTISNLPEMGALRMRGRQSLFAENRSRHQKVVDVLQDLTKRRSAHAKEQGILVQDRKPEDQAREHLMLLSELIRGVLVKSTAFLDQVEPSIEQASTEMNLQGISTGDVDATNVQWKDPVLVLRPGINM